MMTLSIGYPDNEDIYSYNLPLPEHLRSKETLLLRFADIDVYWSYIHKILEELESLEHSRFFKHKYNTPDKIRVCKVLLGRLIDLSLPI